MIKGNEQDYMKIKKGLAYFFLIVFLNISFSNFYKLAFEKVVLMEVLNTVAEEENHSEDGKKLSGPDKDFLSHYSVFSFKNLLLSHNKYYHFKNNLLVVHPEKDSPPPQSLYSIS